MPGPDPDAEPEAGAEEQCSDEEAQGDQPQCGLLALPDPVLHSVMGHLTSAADLAAAAAACSALRSLVRGSRWPAVKSLEVDVWTPALAPSLSWAAASCTQLRHLDLSGAAAVTDGDLAPLARLSALTAMHLGGLWLVTGSSGGGGGATPGRRRSGAGAAGGPANQPLDVLASILGSNRGLLSLDLSGTAVPVGGGLAAALAQLTAGAPNATKPAHGLQRLRLAGCRRAGGGGQGQQAGVLREVLLECPALMELDVSGCRWLTSEALPDSHDALAAALAMLPLRRASFAGCDLLQGIGWLVSSWGRLQRLDLSGTAVDDAELEQIADGCTELTSLSLNGCVRLRGPGLAALAGSLAVWLGSTLAELRLADLAWVGPHELAPLLCMLRLGGASPARLDLSSCGGLNDAALLELLAEEATEAAGSGGAEAQGAGRSGDGSRSSGSSASGSASWRVQELRIAHSSRLSASALQRLAADGACLRSLELLDVSHVQCLGGSGSGSGGSGARGSAAASAATGGARPATQALAALLEAAGGSLRTALLDGCFVGGGLLPLLAHRCPAVERLSIVGCSGLAGADLELLAGLRGLQDLAVGGASLAWHEHRSLTGLTGLTRLRIARRVFLTDAQLAPLLAANRGSLRQLELAGCASLTDAALLHLLPPPGAQQGKQQQGERQQDRLQQQGEQQQDEPQQQQAAARAAPRPPPLQHLSLVCCDRMAGATLRLLGGLRSLRLGGCPAMEQEALQLAAICCTRLTLLELPGHIPASAMPVAAAGHLRGLRLVGGLDEGGGRRGRRRSGGAGTPV